jgi:phosphate:Na+ symporter
MNAQYVFMFLGGICFFIYGITISSKSFETFAFGSFRKFLNKVTSKPAYGALLGAIFTAIIQSSSATTVIVISLVNSGTLNFENALGLIFGSNIGTTITAQIVAFKLTNFSLLIFVAGFLISMIHTKEFIREIGRGIMGIGFIFVGMQFMEQSVAPLKDSTFFINLFMSMSKRPILGVIVSAIFTGIQQSSAVTIGIIQALASNGLLDLNAAFALVIGANIGTTVTALFASIGTNTQAKRAAVSHLMFNVVGAIIFLFIFTPYLSFVWLTSDNLVRQIANSHTFFNVTCTLLFLPFTAQFARFIKRIVPGEEVVLEGGTKFIDTRLLNIPSFAVDALHKEVYNLFQITKKNLYSVCAMVRDNTNKFCQEVLLRENSINQINKEIQAFAPLITKNQLTDEQAKELSLLVNIASQIERIGDITVEISELQAERTKEGAVFSEPAMTDLEKMLDVLRTEYEIVETNFDSFTYDDFKKVEEIEDMIDELEIQLRDAHVERLVNGICNAEAGVIYVDMLSNFERISDHVYKISRLLKEKEKISETEEV